MKFIDINENYHVNIDSIFSLERRIIPNKNGCDNYNARLESISNEIIKNPPTIECNGVMYNPANDDNAKENPLYAIYSEKLKDYLYEQVGEQPPLYLYEYYAILSTGVKVQLAEDKYNGIIQLIYKKNSNGEK